MPDPIRLSSEQVRRVAHLARLRPNDVEIERYRAQLGSILEYVAVLQELNVESAEPLAHPTPGPLTNNRLDPDELRPPLSTDVLRMNAPSMEGPFVAVPKVIVDDDASEGG